MIEDKNTDLKGLNEEYLHVDPLQHAYRKWLTENKAVKESLEKHHTALLVIDLQYLDDAEIEDAGIAIWRSTLGDSYRCNINAWYDPDRVITRIDVTSYKCDEKYREYLDGLVRKR